MRGGGKARWSARGTSVVGAVVLSVALAGCTGDDDRTEPARAATTATTGSATSTTAGAAALDAAAKAFATTTGVSLTMSSTGVPVGAAGLSAAIGVGRATPTKAFLGTATAKIEKTPGTIQVVAVGDVVRARFFSEEYFATDPARYSAPNPADLFSATRGIGTLVTSMSAAAAGDGATVDGEKVLTFTGTVSGDVVRDVLAVGTSAASYAVTVHLSEDGSELRSVTLSGPVYGKATSTVTFTLRDYGQQPTIELPPAAAPQ